MAINDRMPTKHGKTSSQDISNRKSDKMGDILDQLKKVNKGLKSVGGAIKDSNVTKELGRHVNDILGPQAESLNFIKSTAFGVTKLFGKGMSLGGKALNTAYENKIKNKEMSFYEKATKPGSIYTHDIYLETILTAMSMVFKNTETTFDTLARLQQKELFYSEYTKLNLEKMVKNSIEQFRNMSLWEKIQWRGQQVFWMNRASIEEQTLKQLQTLNEMYAYNNQLNSEYFRKDIRQRGSFARFFGLFNKRWFSIEDNRKKLEEPQTNALISSREYLRGIYKHFLGQERLSSLENKDDKKLKSNKTGMGILSLLGIVGGIAILNVFIDGINGVLNIFKGAHVLLLKLLPALKILPRFFKTLFMPITILLGVMDFFKGYFGSDSTTLLGKIIDGVKSILMGLIEMPLRLLGWLTDKILNLFGVEIKGTGQRLVNLFEGAWDLIFDPLKALIDYIASFFSNIWKKGKSLLSNIWPFSSSDDKIMGGRSQKEELLLKSKQNNTSKLIEAKNKLDNMKSEIFNPHRPVLNKINGLVDDLVKEMKGSNTIIQNTIANRNYSAVSGGNNTSQPIPENTEDFMTLMTQTITT